MSSDPFIHVPSTAGAPEATAARPPVALTIAGVDPSGGAGVLADIKTFSALGAYGCAVITALTAQNTQGVAGVSAVDPAFVRQQIDVLHDDVQIDALKVGMLASAPVIEAVATSVATIVRAGRMPHRIVDPVMVATSGDVLLDRSAVGALREALLPLATVVTPNLPEAGVLLGERAPDDVKEMRRAAERLRRLLPDGVHAWVLLKGGHLNGDPVDLLHDGDRMIEMPARRIETRNTHGTGCTLSAALAALAPRSPDIPVAARHAIAYLQRAIAASDVLQLARPRPGGPSGHGPVHHFVDAWGRAPGAAVR